MRIKFWFQKLKERKLSEDIGLDNKIILKKIFGI